MYFSLSDSPEFCVCCEMDMNEFISCKQAERKERLKEREGLPQFVAEVEEEVECC